MAKLVKIIKTSYIMIIFHHALQNLFQVADLKEKKNISVREVKEKKKNKVTKGYSVISFCFINYLEAPVGPTLLLDPPQPCLIKPRRVSVNENTTELVTRMINLWTSRFTGGHRATRPCASVLLRTMTFDDSSSLYSNVTCGNNALL